jgi:hypothetical protein
MSVYDCKSVSKKYLELKKRAEDKKLEDARDAVRTAICVLSLISNIDRAARKKRSKLSTFAAWARGDI